MLRRLNIANVGLMFGATAQGILYRSVLSRNSQWLIALLVLPPWLLIYTVSFFKTPQVRGDSVES
jgi:hypothetical protein